YRAERHAPARGWTSWAVAGRAYSEFHYNLNQSGKVVYYGNRPADYLTDVASGMAARFIKQSAGAPFFVEVATFAPHRPYTPAPRDANAFPGLHAPRTLAFNAPQDPQAPKWLLQHPALSRSDMADIDKEFRKRAQSVQAVDAMIGALQAAGAAVGAEQHSYFVFSSHHGPPLG